MAARTIVVVSSARGREQPLGRLSSAEDGEILVAALAGHGGFLLEIMRRVAPNTLVVAAGEGRGCWDERLLF
jgi:hypothetical protein